MLFSQYFALFLVNFLILSVDIVLKKQNNSEWFFHFNSLHRLIIVPCCLGSGIAVFVLVKIDDSKIICFHWHVWNESPYDLGIKQTPLLVNRVISSVYYILNIFLRINRLLNPFWALRIKKSNISCVTILLINNTCYTHTKNYDRIYTDMD